MRITRKVRKVLDNYRNESPSIQAKLYQILMTGKLAGTGKIVILPVDQGFEHGPDRSFAQNKASYDPDYHYKLAIDAGLNAYAAPIGFISACAAKYAGQIPTILKLNSSNSLLGKDQAPNQAYTGSVRDAVELGCSAVGLTLYPGSDNFLEMIEEAKKVISEAKFFGLPTVIWSYPRGGDLSKEGETAIDVCSYAAHIAALIGAHIIKIKIPTDHIEQLEAKKALEGQNFKHLEDRISHIVKSCFNGKRLVVFSGGASKDSKSILEEVKAISKGGGNGSIIGRNTFQRQREEALKLLSNICEIYKKS